MEEEIGGPETAEAVNTAGPVLEKMAGWNFDWDAISQILDHYESSVYWLIIVMVAIFILGTQLVFFPFLYRGMKQQAPGAMRLAYLLSLLLAVIVFHWWLWHWIFVALTKNYWIWLAWALFFLLWLALVFWTPRRKQES